MTRIFTDGAEMGDYTFWDYGTPSLDSTTKRSGTYSYRYNTNSDTFKYITPISELYFRYGHYNDQLNNATYKVISFIGSGTTHCMVCVNPYAGRFYIYFGDQSSLLDTSDRTFPINMWHLLEVHLSIANSGGVFQLKINGNLECEYIGDTQNGSYAYVDKIYVWKDSSIRVDDIALNDINGTVDNSWCGDGHVEVLTPNGNGSSNNWTGSDGNKTDNYLLVDEIASDGDTTYVYSPSDGSKDYYAMTSLSLGTTKTVSRIWAEVRAKKLNADLSTLKLGVLPSGGTDQLCIGRNLMLGYYRIVGDDYLVNPVDSQPWESGDLDSIQGIIMACTETKIHCDAYTEGT